VTFDPKKIETPEDFVADFARRTTCVCSTLARLVYRERPIGDARPCVHCRARAIVRGEPVGTIREALARRDELLRGIEARIADWRSRRTKK
jgi:hypothetical protein